MAKNETYFTDIKKCVMDGVRGGRAAYNREEAMMMVYNGKVVFNRALYSIEALDAIIPTEGTTNMKGACLVDSIKKDHDGTQTYVDYTISPESIEANNTDKEKSGFYTVTQNVTGLQTTGKYTQPAETFLGYVYLNLQVKSVIYMQAPAEGGFIYPTVSYGGTRRAVYSSGRKVDEVWTGVTDTLLSASGRALVTGATFNTVGNEIGAVYAPDLGTTESEIRSVAEITALSIEAIDGSVLNWSGKEYAYQTENVKTTTYSKPEITASYTDIGANGSAAVLTITWKQTKTEGFSSGADEIVTSLSGTISNSATFGNRITSISGTSYLTGASLVTTSGSASRGNITASSLGYTKKDRTKAYVVSVTVSVNGKSASESVTVYQQANTVSSYYTQPEITDVTAGDVGADGSAAYITVWYSQYIHTYSTANPTGKDTYCGGSASPLTVMGEAVTNNGRKSGVNIIADTWGTSIKPRTIVYRVLSVSIDANGESGLWSGNLNVYQEANAVTNTIYGVYYTYIVVTPVSGGAAPSSWQTTIPTVTESNKYLWLQQTVTFANGSTNVVPSVVGEYRSGKTVKSVTCYYLSSSSSSGVKVSSSGWNTSAPSMSSYNKYLWAYQVIEYSDGIKRQTEPIVIATYSSSSLSSISKKYAVNSECISNIGCEARVSVLCQRPATYIYTSDSTSEGVEDAKATITSTVGSLSSSSITGSGAVTLSIPENTGSGRSITVKATAPDNTQDSATLKQQEVKYEFYTMSLAAIGAPGGDMTINIISQRNGKAWAILASNVSVSDLSGVTVKSVTAVEGGETGEYNITINVPANTYSASRKFKITAIQPSSGKTVTWDAEQAGSSAQKEKVAVVCTPSFTGLSNSRVAYEIFFDATNTNKYAGGTLNNVVIQLNTKADGSGTVVATKTLFSSLTVQAGSCSETVSGTLSNNTGSTLIYFLVYFDNKLQYRTMPMSDVDLQPEEQ